MAEKFLFENLCLHVLKHRSIKSIVFLLKIVWAFCIEFQHPETTKFCTVRQCGNTPLGYFLFSGIGSPGVLGSDRRAAPRATRLSACTRREPSAMGCNGAGPRNRGAPRGYRRGGRQWGFAKPGTPRRRQSWMLNKSPKKKPQAPFWRSVVVVFSEHFVFKKGNPIMNTFIKETRKVLETKS